MRFNPDNFLYLIKQLVTGLNGDSITDSGTASSADGGIKVDLPFPLSSVLLLGGNTSIAAVTDDSNASIVALKTTAGTNLTIGHFSFMIPRDYDEASDHYSVRFTIQAAVGTDLPTITGTPTVFAPGGVATLGTVVPAIVPFVSGSATVGSTEQFLEINFSGLGLTRNTAIDVILSTVGTTTGDVNILGIAAGYDSTIVSYNETDTTDVPGGGANLPGFGNPLR
jgi:hypothetical protein